jgi:methionine-gamma-lyase
VIAGKTLSDCPHVLIEHAFSKFGVKITFIHALKPGAVSSGMKTNSTVVDIGTPATPPLKVIDIRRVCDEAHTEEGVTVVIKNSFASPVCMRPVEQGSDVIARSVTEYWNGGADVIDRAVGSNPDLMPCVRMDGIKDMTGCAWSLFSHQLNQSFDRSEPTVGSFPFSARIETLNGIRKD